ncbi:FtsX-like permease family protein [Herbidospora sp. NEAU-GS84]|uniref:FtsX-like permease family protein n=1 Tax=Herbidospora solisilvae TaxID=2696284 RepID=A0A7C9NF38_9ACTN|nr:FtsX-like permease family protein [Herbidospora solisilvae]NAS21358.1 FtsX-like permease family protein [Herbidospora solisilvae]
MGFLTAWFGVEARRRRRDLCVLVLLVAAGVSVVSAALAGARRGESALDRLRAVTLPAHALISNQDPGLDWERVRALPGVEAVAPYAIAPFYVDDMPLNWFCIPPVDAALWRHLERPVLLAGRLPDPARADEVVVQHRFTVLYGKTVGDTVTIKLNTPEEADLLANAGGGLAGGHGPRITARIVGVIRSPRFADGVDGPGVVLPSSGLYRTYRDNLMGTSGRGFSIALARLTDGAAGVPRLRAQMAALTGQPMQVDDLGATDRHYDRLTSYQALTVLAFGLAALAVAAVSTGLYVARVVESAQADLRVLRAGGLTPRQETAAAALGPVAAGLAGSVLGVGAAAAASVWTPIGAAAGFEPAPGLDVDLLVLAPPLVVVPVLIALEVAVLTWARRTPRPPAGSVVAPAVVRLNLPVQVVTGLRHALSRTVTGTVTGIFGLVAALTFAAGVADAAGDPARFGQTHQAMVFHGQNGEHVEGVLGKTARDPDVTGVADARAAMVSAGDVVFVVYGVAPVSGRVPPMVVRGRPPTTDGEVLLAVGTANRMGADVGDRVRLTGPDGAGEFRVSAVGLLPVGVSNTYDDGALLTSGGYDRLSRSFDLGLGLLALRPGADPGVVLRRLQEATGPRVSVIPAVLPPQFAEVRDVRVLPIVLAGCLGLLAVATLAHAVNATARRRRHDVAVLRALGMTPGQARWIPRTQALALAGAGLLAGVPLGVAAGRALWRLVAESTPLVYVPPTPVEALVPAVPAALVAALVLAALPGRRAAGLHVAGTLRAE